MREGLLIVVVLWALLLGYVVYRYPARGYSNANSIPVKLSFGVTVIILIALTVFRGGFRRVSKHM
jgi:hypothetical protein